MNHHVAHTSIVVNSEHNQNVDNRRRRGQIPSMGRKMMAVQAKPLEECKSLADRLLWVLHARRDVIPTSSDWATMAGLSRTAVSTAINRDARDMRGASLAALADVAKVSLAWLTSGTGHPDDIFSADESGDPFPARKYAIAHARKRGLVSESAIIKARQFSGTDYEFKDQAAWSELLHELTIKELTTNVDAFQERLRDGGSGKIREKLARKKDSDDPAPQSEAVPAIVRPRRKAG